MRCYDLINTGSCLCKISIAINKLEVRLGLRVSSVLLRYNCCALVSPIVLMFNASLQSVSDVK